MAVTKKTDRKKAVTGHFIYDEFLKLVSKRIKSLRKEKGFKSAELFAYDVEVSRVGMSKYETGTFTDIRLKSLLKIIDGLEITPTEFFSKGFESLKFKSDLK